jgi:hypothetical protein
MKGVSYVLDDNDRKKAVIIDLKTIEKFDSQLEDLFDIIIAESRKGEKTIPFEEVVRDMKKRGKLSR